MDDDSAPTHSIAPEVSVEVALMAVVDTEPPNYQLNIRMNIPFVHVRITN